MNGLSTNGKFVSSILGSLNSVTKDDRIPRRQILSIGESKARNYISQKLLDRTLHNETNLFTTIPCLVMEPQETIKCDVLEFRRCKTLMRSADKIPGLIFSKYGDSIILVTSVDGEVEFNKSSVSDYSNNIKRKHYNLSKNYYLHDDYLYIPDVEIEAVSVILISQAPYSCDLVKGCSNEDKDCKSIWDYPFICPDKTIDAIRRETLVELATITKRIPKDENPNLDSNQKSETQ